MIIDSPIISGSYLSTGSLSQTGNVSITGSLTATAGISGSFSGSGADLFGIPATGITGLNLSQISSGSVSASVSPNNGFVVNTNTKISGSTQITGSLGVTGSFSVSGSTGTVFSSNADSLLITGSLLVTGSTIITGSLSVSGSITGSLEGTASYSLFALTSSYSLGGSGFPFSGSAVITGSLLVSGSAEITGSLSVSGSISASLFGTASQATSASYALTASYLLGYISPFPFTGSAAITGSLIVTGSVSISNLVTSSGVRYVIADQNGLLSAQTASAAIFTTQQVVSTAGQTAFPITNGYATGYVTVFVNGTKLSADEYVDTSGTNIVFLTGSTAGDNVEFQKYLPAAGVSNNTLRSTNYFTATTGQTNFSVNYTPGLLDIFYNGAKLDNTEYTAANGTSITLATASAAGDRLEVDVYSYQVGAFSGIGGTGAANQLAYFNTSNSITGSNAFTVSGSAIIITGSLTVSGSGTFTNIGPAVFSGSVTSTAGFSGSFSGNADSASLAQNSLLLQGTGSIGFATTASLLAVSASQQQISSSLLNVIANYATTGSNSFRADQSITGSLVVSSTITAQTLVVQTVTSSIVYSSGSNIFGSALGDRQTFTGSIAITGSIGIGTTPAADFPLRIRGGGSTRIKLETAPTLAGALDFYNDSVAVWSMVVDNTQTYAKIENRALSIDAIRFYSSSNNVVLTPTTGNVGIGITNPATPLQILKDTNTNGTNIEESNMAFTVLSAAGQSKISIGACNAGNYGYVQVMQDATSWTTRNLTLQPRGGNVGIGTYTPGRLLTVNGDSTLLGNNYISTSKFFQWEGGAYWTTRVTSTGNQFEIYRGDTGASPFTITSANLVQVSNATQTDDLGILQIQNTYANPGSNTSLTVKSYSGTGQFMQWENYGMRIGSRIKTNTGAGGIYFTYGNDSVGMTITSDGTILAGGASATGAYSFSLGNATANTYYQVRSANTNALYGADTRGTWIGNLSSKETYSNGGHFVPGVDNTVYCGSSSYRWAAVFAVNGAIQTSDQRLKTNIQTSDLGLDFITQLNPVSYKWIVGGSTVEYSSTEDENGKLTPTSVATPFAGRRTHYGLIAQQVKQVLGDKDFGGYVYDEETDTMSLRYDQFISPLIKAIQEQNVLIQELQEKLQRNNIN